MASKGLGKGLGSGLGAMFGEAADGSRDFEYVPISRVEPREAQPRTEFGEPELQELADSIAEHGIIQPLTVRSMGDGYYQIIAGERRWRAARMAELTQIPVRIISADDRKAAELAMVENLQREDLGAIEEARGYRQMMEEYGMTQAEVARQVSKSRPVIANALRLLTLPEEVVSLVEKGDLSAGAARALPSIEDEAEIPAAAKRVVKEGLSVREAERLAKRLNRRAVPENPDNRAVKVDYLDRVATELTRALGRKVRISGGEKRGRIELEYYDRDDFELLCRTLEAINRKKEKKK